MKRMLFWFLLYCPLVAEAQDSINPYNIAQSCNIILHDSNVYYRPFAPPASTDQRAWLSCQANGILDSNGRFGGYQYFSPFTHGQYLYNWAPCGVKLDHTPWQRLFTARRKPNGQMSDIIAGSSVADGSRVTISANEDVDFRASGRVILKSGFHAKPGCFFHAYTEPKFDSVVFSDNFDSINRSQWYITTNGSNPESGGIQCDYDTDVVIDTDYQATDGHALDIMLRENTAKYSSQVLDYPRLCGDSVQGPIITPYQSVFSSALVRACPWPMMSRDSFSMAYQHMPYGKYEIREKTPHVLHHTNNWLWGSFEIDINEEGQNDTSTLRPMLHKDIRHGPDTGHFQTIGGTHYFISTEAGWCLSNQPRLLFINNFAYNVKLTQGNKDTVVLDGGFMPWPSSLTGSSAPVSFYYSRRNSNVSDNVTWHVYQDSAHHWRIFSAPYHDSSGTWLRFSKPYQPGSITLHDSIDSHGDTITHTYQCYWDSTLNWPVEKGLLYLSDTGLAAGDLDSNTEAYSYSQGDPEYQRPYYSFHWGDTTTPYEYHTYAVEVLPNEMRFLYDSNVFLRIPDRMIPPNNPYYDFMKNLDRTPMNFYIGELDEDNDEGKNDPFGIDSVNDTRTYRWRKNFEYAAAAAHWPGFWPYHGQPTAHKLIDYVRVWDVPAGTPITNFPH